MFLKHNFGAEIAYQFTTGNQTRFERNILIFFDFINQLHVVKEEHL